MLRYRFTQIFCKITSVWSTKGGHQAIIYCRSSSISAWLSNISILKQVQKVSVALGFHFSIGDKAQGCAVYAVTHAVRRLRVFGKHMTEVGVTSAAAHLRAAHPVAQILFFHHGGTFDRFGEGWPATGALVLIRGGKKRLAGDDIHIDTLFKFVPELACEGTLRAVLLRDAVLLLRQLVTNGLRRGFLIVARVDASLEKSSISAHGMWQ